MAPTGEESPFVVRQYGCSLSSTDIIAENAEEDPAPLFLLPEQFHAYEGMTGEYIYTGEVFTNTRGGLSTHDAIRYRGNLDLVLNVDTAAMDMWKGGRFFIYGIPSTSDADTGFRGRLSVLQQHRRSTTAGCCVSDE